MSRDNPTPSPNKNTSNPKIGSLAFIFHRQNSGLDLRGVYQDVEIRHLIAEAASVHLSTEADGLRGSEVDRFHIQVIEVNLNILHSSGDSHRSATD